MTFEIAPDWQPLRGMAFGLQQPTLVGRVFTPRVSDAQLRCLGDRMQQAGDLTLQGHGPSADTTQRFVFQVLDWAGALQRRAVIPVSPQAHVQLAGHGADGRLAFMVAVPGHRRPAHDLAMRWVAAQVRQLLHEQAPPADLPATADDLLQALQAYEEPGLNEFHILQAAQRLRLPVQDLVPGVRVFGSGCRAQLYTSSVTERTSYIGSLLAHQKSHTARTLRALGLPGAVNAAVASADEAVAAAARLGYPVVVKPDDAERGEGVSANLPDAASVHAAYAVARQCSASVLVERFIQGSTHRLTVFQGRVVRVVRRVAGGVDGDGVHTVAQLVAALPPPADAIGRVVRPPLALDDEALGLLHQAGLTPQQVPAAGQRVRLRRRDNISAGGHNVEVPLAEVHPDNLRLGVDAARALRLDFAGIDLISPDLAVSWLDNGAGICEVNARPQMGVGGGRDTYDRLLPDWMGGAFTVPVHLVLCDEDPALRVQQLNQHATAEAGLGVSDRSGLWLGGQRATRPFGDGFQAARALLLRTDVQRAVCLCSCDDIIRHGFPMPWVTGLTVAGVADAARAALARAMVPLDDPKRR